MKLVGQFTNNASVTVDIPGKQPYYDEVINNQDGFCFDACTSISDNPVDMSCSSCHHHIEKSVANMFVTNDCLHDSWATQQYMVLQMDWFKNRKPKV